MREEVGRSTAAEGHSTVAVHKREYVCVFDVRMNTNRRLHAHRRECDVVCVREVHADIMECNEWLLICAIFASQATTSANQSTCTKEHLLNHTITVIGADILRQESSARSIYLS